MNLFWRGCFCCRSFKETSLITIFILDSVISYYYHENCLKEVVCNPEKYSNSKLYTALAIIDEKKIEKKIREDNLKAANKACCEIKNGEL